jgi:hypothetical protein
MQNTVFKSVFYLIIIGDRKTFEVSAYTIWLHNIRFVALDMLSKHTHIHDRLYLILNVQLYMYILLKSQMSRIYLV